MSNALLTVTLLEGIRSAVLAAWGSMPISYGPPRVPAISAPYAVVHWNAVDISFRGEGGSVSNPSQKNAFAILGRFPFPSDPTQIISLAKVDKANALIAALQAGPVFCSAGILPLVTKVDPTEPDDPNEKVYEVTLTFEVVTIASHG